MPSGHPLTSTVLYCFGGSPVPKTPEEAECPLFLVSRVLHRWRGVTRAEQATHPKKVQSDALSSSSIALPGRRYDPIRATGANGARPKSSRAARRFCGSILTLSSDW